MCVLKLSGAAQSFKPWACRTVVPVYSVYDAGEHMGGRVTDEHRVSFDVSNHEWDDFPSQVADAIAFLTKHFDALADLLSSHDVEDACLDFPILSRLDGNIVNQNDYLPKDLVRLAGALGLSIGMSHYARDAFGEDEQGNDEQHDDEPSGAQGER